MFNQYAALIMDHCCYYSCWSSADILFCS